MKLPPTLERSDWPLRIARPYWLLTPQPLPGQRDRIFRRFATDAERTAWLEAHGYVCLDTRPAPEVPRCGRCGEGATFHDDAGPSSDCCDARPVAV